MEIRREHRACSRRGSLAMLASLVATVGGTRAAAASFAPATAIIEARLSGPAAVTGTIIFPAGLPAGAPATVVARIEDVSRADAPATVLSSVTLSGATIPPPPGEQVVFSIPVPDYDPRMRYSVRVHVDRDGDGQVTVGDLVSTSSTRC